VGIYPPAAPAGKQAGETATDTGRALDE
jgi:hypothetical protein